METKETEIRLKVFGELIGVGQGICLWSYNSSGDLLKTTSQDLIISSIFRHSTSYPFMEESFRSASTPLLLSNPIGVVWGASVENTGKSKVYHVIGPVYTQSKTLEEIRRDLVFKKEETDNLEHYVDALSRLPVVSMTSFFQAILMLQCAITGERLSNSDIRMQIEQNRKHESENESMNQNDRLKVFLSEETMLGMIRSGHLDKELMNQCSKTFTGTQKYSSNPLQHAKLARALFAGKALKAAIEGGVSTDLAYTRQDLYMQDLEKAKRLSEINQLSLTMFQDWVDLVHKAKNENNYSKAVQSCCNYIETHINDQITINLLAEKTGYSDYYLSRKFRSEVGIGIDDYVKKAKVEKAKTLLSDTHMQIQEIARTLSFGTRNYFAQVFHNITGTSPQEYRKNNQHF